MIKVGSDFSGVGAFNQALQRLGIDYEEVFACDMDKYARQTFIHNYGHPKYYPENVYDREISSESLDVYMTSPPCQAFSLAGKRLGKADKRGILFFNSHDFIQVNKPRFFIFENVKGLLSDDGGNTFNEWINLLGGKSVNGNPVIFPVDESVPYHVYWKVLNAKNHNIPQNRERVFIVGIRDDADNVFSWPKEIPLQKRLKDVLEEDVPEKYFLSNEKINQIKAWNSFKNPFECNLYGIKENEIMSCLTARGDGNEHSGMKILKVKSATKSGFEVATENDSINFSVPNSETRRGRVGKGVAQTLDTSCNQGIIHNCITQAIGRQGSSSEYIDSCKKIYQETNKIRRLTPRECFRLMDFPDTFTWSVSDSQAYKQAGNSICVGVLAAIIKNLNL